jgi:hypothetical protein
VVGAVLTAMVILGHTYTCDEVRAKALTATKQEKAAARLMMTPAQIRWAQSCIRHGRPAIGRSKTKR